jgi:hypothetical protein
MGFYTKSGEIDEAAWIKTYMDLAGVTESAARSVFMYVACKETINTEDECENNSSKPNLLFKAAAENSPKATRERSGPDTSLGKAASNPQLLHQTSFTDTFTGNKNTEVLPG